MANKRDDDREYMNSPLVGWLSNFADREAAKYANDTSSNKIESILDIVGRNKKTSVEEKVAQYRELAGLDMVDKIEKEGGREITASYIKLSQFDAPMNSNEDMDRIKQYVESIVKNRNGHIATPAIFEQLGDFLGLGKDWLHENYEQVERVIESVKNAFQPEQYAGLSPMDLARNEVLQEDDENESTAPEGKVGT